MDVTVGANEVSSGRVTLVAGEVLTVTFARNIYGVQIVSDGSAAVYYTTSQQLPTVDGRHTYELPAGVAAVDERNTDASDTIRLISNGTPSVRVTGL